MSEQRRPAQAFHRIDIVGPETLYDAAQTMANRYTGGNRNDFLRLSLKLRNALQDRQVKRWQSGQPREIIVGGTVIGAELFVPADQSRQKRVPLQLPDLELEDLESRVKRAKQRKTAYVNRSTDLALELLTRAEEAGVGSPQHPAIEIAIGGEPIVLIR